MQKHLESLGKSMAIFHGEPIKIFENLIAKHEIVNVFTNHDYEPYAR
jgi:deoxyribodipyrimidine photo-lyase